MDTPSPSVPAIPRRRARWRRPWVWMLTAFLAAAGWSGWREYDYNSAVREAEALEFEWKTSASPLDAIRADWHAAFRLATWTESSRVLRLSDGCDLARQRRLIRRLHPTELDAPECRNVDALRGLTGLRCLDLGGSDVRDLALLSELIQLRDLYLYGCKGVADLTPLASLARLQALHLRGCKGVTDLAPLAGLAQLQNLDLRGCTGVTDLTPLAGLAQLQYLDLDDCTGVTNLTPLSGLAQLWRLDLTGCKGLSAEAVAAFRQRHPNVSVIGP